MTLRQESAEVSFESTVNVAEVISKAKSKTAQTPKKLDNLSMDDCPVRCNDMSPFSGVARSPKHPVILSRQDK
ncbi:unnamed protein product [Brachionus calyciflorus]|uniref:Uncharacterized protein n=1 Tax=Brachionus calyciflorus TaxID=104777 RepID=A0A814KHW8_9BILA|nr:unnamed protein product [Brachionus calyciflorus]